MHHLAIEKHPPDLTLADQNMKPDFRARRHMYSHLLATLSDHSAAFIQCSHVHTVTNSCFRHRSLPLDRFK